MYLTTVEDPPSTEGERRLRWDPIPASNDSGEEGKKQTFQGHRSDGMVCGGQWRLAPGLNHAWLHIRAGHILQPEQICSWRLGEEISVPVNVASSQIHSGIRWRILWEEEMPKRMYTQQHIYLIYPYFDIALNCTLIYKIFAFVLVRSSCHSLS